MIGYKEADDPYNKWFIGHDTDQIWDYERDGVWQLGEEEEAAKYGNKPGDFKYIDQNNDGVMDNDDKIFRVTPLHASAGPGEMSSHSIRTSIYPLWCIRTSGNTGPSTGQPIREECSTATPL